MTYSRTVNQIADIEYQASFIESIMDRSVYVEFVECDHFPTSKQLDDLTSFLHIGISNNDKLSKELELLTELQILIIQAFIVGVSPLQLTLWTYCDWDDVEQFYYSNKEMRIIGKNMYCDKLIGRLKQYRLTEGRNNTNIFQILNAETILSCINGLLILNGIEATMNLRKIEIFFGRYHYLMSGRIAGIREFLKSYFQVQTHIDLLVELKLVNTIHYSTMLRN